MVRNPHSSKLLRIRVSIRFCSLKGSLIRGCLLMLFASRDQAVGSTVRGCVVRMPNRRRIARRRRCSPRSKLHGYRLNRVMCAKVLPLLNPEWLSCRCHSRRRFLLAFWLSSSKNDFFFRPASSASFFLTASFAAFCRIALSDG